MAEGGTAARRTKTPAWVDDLLNQVFGRRFPRWDVIMATLALLNTLALLVRSELLLPGALPLADAARWGLYVLYADYALLAFYAGEYLVSVVRAEKRGEFVRATWYDLVGLIPLPIAFLRAFRLLRVAHVLFWGSRFPHEAEHEFGGALTLTVLKRHEPRIVEDLTDPVLVRAIQVLREALARGRYLESVGENLNARRDRIHAVVMRSMERKPALKVLMSMPGAGPALEAAGDQLVDVLVATLTDPDLDAVLKESLDDSLRELQERIAARSEEAPPAGADAVGRAP